MTDDRVDGQELATLREPGSDARLSIQASARIAASEPKPEVEEEVHEQ
jgi:hypothetical protein